MPWVTRKRLAPALAVQFPSWLPAAGCIPAPREARRGGTRPCPVGCPCWVAPPDPGERGHPR